MDFFKEVQKCKTMEDIQRLLTKYNLNVRIELHFWSKINRLFGLPYSAEIYIYNDVVTYKVECEILEADKLYPLSKTFININSIKVL